MREPMIPSPRKPMPLSARRPSLIRRILPHRASRCAAAPRAPASRCLARQRLRRRACRARGAPSPPPAAPRGAVPAALGDQREAHLARALRSSRTTPSPPRWRPAPPEPRRSAYSITRSGNSRSSASIGVFSVLLIATCTRARPVGVRARALAAAERLVVGEALVAEREVVHRALSLRAAERARARGRRRARRSPRCRRRPLRRAARSARCPRGARTSSGR